MIYWVVSSKSHFLYSLSFHFWKIDKVSSVFLMVMGLEEAVGMAVWPMLMWVLGCVPRRPLEENSVIAGAWLSSLILSFVNSF